MDTNLNFATVARRLGDEISMDIVVVLCGADHEGKEATTHPNANNTKEELASIDINRPIMSIAKDIVMVGLRPYL